MPAIYTRGGDTLNENILLKIFAFDDSASDARTPCIARGWDAVRRGPPLLLACFYHACIHSWCQVLSCQHHNGRSSEDGDIK